VSAAGSAATAPLVDSATAGGVVQGAIVTTLVGGTLSRLSGGKFANGAVTAAFSYAIGSMANRGTDVVGSGGAGGAGAGNPTADAFLQAESANAGQLFCSASCEVSADAAHAAAGNRYLGASLATRREVAWHVYDVGDGTFSFSYPSISGVGHTQLELPPRLPGLSRHSAGHTHWDSNHQFSPQDWRLITQEARRGPGVTLYLASGDGRLQYSTPAHARGFGITRGASFSPPRSNFSGYAVPGVQLRTTYP
jgi:hypothetical protein